MQNLVRTSLSLAIAALSGVLLLRAEEAVVDEGKINVRGRPSLIGEVVTQLQRGEKVEVLERIKVENPKPGDPETWAKIKLPENTPVWVFSPFIKEGAVAVNRLNLRAGPGENYSVLGRLDRGETVKPIRTIEEWMEIEAPEGAYAFVDASLIKSSGTDATAAPTAPAVTGAAVAVPAGQDQAVPPPVTTNPAATPAPPPVAQSSPELKPAVVETPPSAVVAAPSAASTAVTRITQPLPQVAPPPTVRERSPGKRLVRREGIVRATRSIQAPTWYELIHPETKAVINYLHEERLGVNLKGYRGQKIVVTGEEAIDPRWPNTPILEMETLDFAP